MIPPTPDYSGYELAQLYDLVCNVDSERFPERLAAIRQQIELRGGDPNIPPVPPFWTPRAQVTTTLKVVRWLVGMEYGFPILWGIYLIADDLRSNDTWQLSIVLLFVSIIGVLCALGVGVMHNALDSISNRAAVEIGWLSAVGLAPISTALYTAIAFYYATAGYLLSLQLLFVTTIGFLSPFLFLTFWVKYHFRSDEF